MEFANTTAVTAMELHIYNIRALYTGKTNLLVLVAGRFNLLETLENRLVKNIFLGKCGKLRDYTPYLYFHIIFQP